MPTAERATRTRRSSFPLARVAAAITIASWVVQGVQRQAPSTMPPPPGKPAPEAVPLEEAPSWATDITQNVGPPPLGGRVVTGRLLNGQKPARNGQCGGGQQVAIGAGCWLALEMKPKPPPVRCEDYFEYNGKCYIPIKAEPKLPTSIQEKP